LRNNTVFPRASLPGLATIHILFPTLPVNGQQELQNGVFGNWSIMPSRVLLAIPPLPCGLQPAWVS